MSNTVKHFADYSLEGGRYGVPSRMDFNGIVSTQDQMEYYFPAWREVIESGHAKSMMCSYPAINGVPGMNIYIKTFLYFCVSILK